MPTVVDVFLDRPAILEPAPETAAAVVANWGASAEALLDVLTGAALRGAGCRSTSREHGGGGGIPPDVPFDTEDPLFRFGHGLALVAGGTDPRAASSFDEAAARAGWSVRQGTETDSSCSVPSTEMISI